MHTFKEWVWAVRSPAAMFAVVETPLCKLEWSRRVDSEVFAWWSVSQDRATRPSGEVDRCDGTNYEAKLSHRNKQLEAMFLSHHPVDYIPFVTDHIPTTYRPHTDHIYRPQTDSSTCSLLPQDFMEFSARHDAHIRTDLKNPTGCTVPS